MGPLKQKVREQVSQAQDRVDERMQAAEPTSEPEMPAPDYSGTPPLH